MRDSHTPTELSSRYDPAGLEGPMYQRWVDAGLFHVPAADAGQPYVIVIPPPNVTAALHMGHGLNNTLQDVLIRRRRMQGFDVLWVPGTDHAGIATQNVVERQLGKQGLTRFDLGRDGFVDRVWEWVGEYGGRIIDQLRVIGCSCDWKRTRFTLDEGLSNAVREVFVRLYEKDLVYRGRYIINWCPRCRTALSNEEAEHRDLDGKLFRIRYPLVAGGHVEVATTRPETMLGDTGLAVSPADERYRGLVGSEAELPLVGRRLPIVADEHVDPGFGSGVVKVTPAHDPNDFEIGRRHGLDALDVMTDGAAMNDTVPEAYRGLDRFEARERVVADLEAGGWLVSVEDHPHSVGRCYRCDTVVEPRLSLQWFVRMKPLAEPGLAAYQRGELRFHPPRYGRVYRNWMENIRDWCISRQLWWGHRIPVWYCEAAGCGEMVVSTEDPDACPACGGALRQDEDVLDTWFSSWLWPFSTLGWPEPTEDLKAFYPTAALVTAPEILFFWVARMIMAGFEFMGSLPFNDVLLNGTVRDHLGRRMSKSLGNGIDPLEVVDLYGADAMRFTLVRGSPLGTDIQLDYENLEAAFRPGRNFANKMWNAARFALPHARRDAPEEDRVPAALADRWIRSRLACLGREMDAAYEEFRLHEAAETGHAFVWGDFCDWYLELAKRRLGEEGEAALEAGRTLTVAMRGWLSLLHPIMPFVTEAIADRLPDAAAAGSLVTGPWPDYPAEWIDPAVDAAIEALREFVGAVRALRAEYGIAQGARPVVELTESSPALLMALAEEQGSALRLAGLSSIKLHDGTDGGTEAWAGAGAHAVLRMGGELFIPLEGLIDLGAKSKRIKKEVARTTNLITGSRRKLENAGFLANAPAQVVEREREKLTSLEEQRTRLEGKLQSLGPYAGLVAAFILLGCAKEMPPPGAHPDELAPSIVRISPAPDSIVAGFDGQLDLRFDEPVRIPNDIGRQMFVTPMEPYEVETGFSNLRLTPEDGWRDDVVYCYTIPTEGISDLLRNRMEEPAEFCFSTGSEMVDTGVRGSVLDALTGEPPREARVIFWAGPDSIPYGAVTDSVGEFVARGLPAGEYEAFGFVDRNRNLVPDRELESYDSVSVVASPDAVRELSFVLVAPDTTPPLLARAIPAGRETVQLEFDDFLLNPQPGEPAIAIRDSAAAVDLEIVDFLIGSADAVTFASDSATVDSAGVAGDSLAAGDPAAVGDSTAAAADSTEVEEDPILPSRFITVRLAEALDSATYLVSVTGVVNLRQFAGGGDTSFVAEPEPEPEPAAADTLGAPGDTLGAPPDTVGRRRPWGGARDRPRGALAARRPE